MTKGQNSIFHECHIKGECGGRWCEFCTVLRDTEFKDGICSFQKPKMPNPISKMIRMINSGEDESVVAADTGLSYALLRQAMYMAKERGYIR